MEQIWAPWRMEYILQDKETDCFLCNAQKQEDSKSFIVYRGEKNFVIMNKFPYNNGHLMIAPYRHIGNLEDLTDQEHLEIMQSLVKAKEILDKALTPEGYNIGINLGNVSGAGLPGHLHLHVVPRWNGDTNFMPVIADTKIMPEYLKETYEKIKKC